MSSMLLNKKAPRKRNVRRGAPPVVKPRRLRPRARATDEQGASGDERPRSEARPANDAAPAKRDDQANFLATYFREMAALEVLQPQQEFVAARDIEALEVLVWERIFAYPPLVPHLAGLIEASLEQPMPELRALRKLADGMRGTPTKAKRKQLHGHAHKVAVALRPLDVDKIYLDGVLSELDKIERGVVTHAAGKRLRVVVTSATFQEYMRRVRQAVRGAANARNNFVRANLRLVVSIARRFNHGRMALADLIQEGNLGLMKAVERYDYRRGFRFSTYASWWIRHAISRALADKGREVRLPVHMIDAYHRIAKATRELTAKLGRQPTSEEIAEAANIAAHKIDRMRTYLVDQSFSLDRPVNDEDGRHLAEYLQDPNAEESSPTPKPAAGSMYV